jgi:hypothetical protein
MDLIIRANIRYLLGVVLLECMHAIIGNWPFHVTSRHRIEYIYIYRPELHLLNVYVRTCIYSPWPSAVYVHTSAETTCVLLLMRSHMPATDTAPPNLKIDIELWYDSEIDSKKQNKNKTCSGINYILLLWFMIEILKWNSSYMYKYSGCVRTVLRLSVFTAQLLASE